MPQVKDSKRIGWLDTMKGIAIFFVVLRHVFIGMHLMNHPVSYWIHLFHMPFFFLLSGFLVVKSLKQSVWQIYKKKALALILPFFTCGMSLSLFQSNIDDYVFTLMHNGYWFLLSLFSCWLILAPIAIWVKKINNGYKIVIETILVILPFFIGGVLMKKIPNHVNTMFSFPLTFSMYRFFIVGYFLGQLYFAHETLKKILIVRKFGGMKNLIEKFLYPLSVVIFAVFSIGHVAKWSVITVWPETVHQLMLSVSLFFTIYGVHTHIAKSIGKILQYVGRNTLPIYVFHFYIVYGFFAEPLLSYNRYYQTLWACLICVLVIAVTLMFSIPFRTNKYLKMIFLGTFK